VSTAEVNCVASWAYTVLYDGVRAFQAVGEPDVPEKAMAGIPVDGIVSVLKASCFYECGY
jgi:hypothetical protein